MEDHVHAQRLGQHRQLGADRAIAHDAQRLAADLERVLGALLPAAAVRHGVLLGNAAQQQNGFGQHQLGHRARVRIGRVEDDDAALARRVQVHLVGADAEAPDGHELVRGREHLGRELGARADADEVRIGDLALELLALQSAGQRFHVRVAGVLQHLERRWMNAFEQQKLDLRLVQRCLGHGGAHLVKTLITAELPNRYRPWVQCGADRGFPAPGFSTIAPGLRRGGGREGWFRC